MTIFIIVKSRFVMIFLHKTKDEFPHLLKKAIAQAGRTPKTLRTDNAKEYRSAEIDKFCADNKILQQSSNPHQQFGNTLPEKMVDTISRGVRVALHDANLPPNFWGYAAVNFVDVYNHLPHSSLDYKTPWECEKNSKPDVSWFRPFGCRATVFIGDHKECLPHKKLSPRGESCIYLGLGFSRGYKGWVCLNPETQRVYCTRDVIFDETFMPARVHDQRILGYYDCTPRTRISSLIHGDPISVLDTQEETRKPSPVDIDNILASDPETEADASAQLPPYGRDAHDEADMFLDPQDM
jgi:histone deacetylase 1/2